MSGYLLDTQTIRYWSDGESGQFPAVQHAAEQRAPSRRFMSPSSRWVRLSSGTP